jgi:tetratricopeptide (TPR) repeat protein
MHSLRDFLARRGWAAGRWPMLAVLCLTVSLGAGCSALLPKKASQYDIPMQDSVAAQWKFAMTLHNQFNDPVLKNYREENGIKTLAAYQKVVNAWPEETDFVNRSRLAIAIVTDDMGKHKEALALYEKLRREVPNDEKIVVNCLFSAARIYEEIKQYDKSQEYYREIIQTFKDKKDPYFKDFVTRSENLRNQIHKR